MNILNPRSNHPLFHIGAIPIFGRFILAPMDGYSDQPFRSITHELGSAITYTEFINVLEVLSKNTKYERRCQFAESERPVALQLFDEDPERIIRGAKILYEKYHPNMIDINMGCSVNHVANRGAGAGLLKEPQKIKTIISGLVHTLPIPITAKIRLGWDQESINYPEIGKIIQDCGGALIALHARTREQLFKGTVDWDAIAFLKQSLTIPVIGNGDISSPLMAQEMMHYTKCDAVMIGRTAIENPWIFAGFDLGDVPPALFYDTVITHLEETKKHYGDMRGCIVFRKFAKKYLLHLGVEIAPIRNLLTTSDPTQFTGKMLLLLDEAIRQANHD